MRINRPPAIKNYWSAEEGIGNSLIQKALARARFWEILQNLRFTDNLQKPPRDMVSNMGQSNQEWTN